MSALNFAELMEAAAAEGFSNEILPDGEYAVEVAGTNCSKSQGGKEQIGVRFKVIAGPHAGKSFWENMTISPESPKALAIFFRQLAQMSVSSDFIRSASSTESIASAIVVGSQFSATLGHREYNGKTYQSLKGLKAAAGVQVAAPAVAAPFGAPAAVPAPAPIPAGAPAF